MAMVAWRSQVLHRGYPGEKPLQTTWSASVYLRWCGPWRLVWTRTVDHRDLR